MTPIEEINALRKILRTLQKGKVGDQLIMDTNAYIQSQLALIEIELQKGVTIPNCS